VRKQQEAPSLKQRATLTRPRICPSALILDFPIPRNVRNKFLGFKNKLFGLIYFDIAT
jgi:hypothetical protein